MDLGGRTALITGGTSGIGRATAEAFVAAGARVAITGQDRERLATAAALLPAIPLHAEMRDLASIAALRTAAAAAFPRLDVLFVNAGVAFATPIETTDDALYDRIMDINLKGAFFTVQALLPLMQRGGSIILNTSWLAEVGTPGLSLLSASKAALRSLARNLSAELLPRGIRVNAVSPGATDTPIHAKTGMAPDALAAFADRLRGAIPLGRFGRPDNVAAAALFLASDRSSYMLGAEMSVDGGFAQL
ncbi:SDR family oxidoreductase [Paracraurococcus ruber]|uniref:Short-chain dehydrogenase n=1 Tax=Paracraurococcus ruber TaxID=77675 RepID=A0ABS1D3D2_9PROT|nr:SDR family oxidoreductase [Paracraurococcus ruber]MBK1661358.1 short-chain dehydrogenase [Paracraurococcus ruber]TDG25032.1 SDR family oxidoreductase [Paracraurococcus ruber]